MTNDKLKAMNARCEAATEGPWQKIKFCLNAVGVFFGGEFPREICSYTTDAVSNKFPVRVARDLDFIAHARTDLPACLKEIERLQKVIEASKDCDLVGVEMCPCVRQACETCEHNIYPAAVRKALEQE